MARYENTIPTDESPDDLTETITNYLEDEGFQLIDRNENVWKKGMGLLLGPQYVSFEVKPGKLYLEAWIKFALLPGVYIGEMGIDGVIGFIPKKQLKARVEKIERMA